MLTISSISAFQDNYIWVIEDYHQNCAIVDPGDADVVFTYLKENNLKLQAILLTHHHHDHTGGVNALIEAFPKLEIYGPDNDRFPWVTHPMNHESQFHLFETKFTAFETPGHTLDHIVYFNGKHLFCGDTLFSGGCGRLFEGSAKQMLESLTLLSKLPDKTGVYCAHEYTLANLKFAIAVEPDNQTLLNYYDEISNKIKAGLSSLPSTIGIEKTINPFLRVTEHTIKSALKSRIEQTSDLHTFAALRNWKDTF